MTDLHAKSFQNDPRIIQAHQLVMDALEDHQKNLTQVAGPHPDRQVEYQKMVDAFGEIRGGALFYPYLGSGFGNGPLVELADGSVKYDMISGIGVHGMGHGYRPVVSAAFHAAIGDTIMQGNLQQNVESAELAEKFVNIATTQGASLSHCFMTTTGVMANENALKMIFQAKFPRNRLLAFSKCFAGRTMAVAAITDRAKYRDGIPPTLNVDYIPFFDTNDPKGSTQRAVSALKSHLQRYPNQHAGMIFEMIQGEGGYNLGHRDFFIALMDILRENDVAVFVDEIQTFGRTTKPFAFQHFQLDDYVDVVTVGKITQVCVTLFTDEFKPRPGLISQTFTGATSSIYASHTILNEFKSGGYFGENGKIMQFHNTVAKRLDAIHNAHPDWVNGPYGIGGMIAFTPFDGSLKKTRPFLDALFHNGVIAFSTGGEPYRIRMLMPTLCMNDEHIQNVMDIVEQTLGEQAGV